MNKRAKISLIVLSVLLAVLLIAGCVYYYRIFLKPEALFQPPATPIPTATPAASAALPAQPSPTPAPTVDPYERLLSEADRELMEGIVNVLLVGVDYAPEREDWNGKHAYHADVMMVLAVNFNENRADLISLPRDTFAKMPGVEGIYKLNASIDCGGGYPDGLPKVMEAASWMLGGIPVDYYYAVTMPVVKELVDAIGGVDYDMDVDFTLAGRNYEKGLQHLDGQGVLDYLRVRKNVEKSGDLNRINRQKRMLLTVFDTMKKKNLLVKLPELVEAFDGKLLTNATLEQTAALAVFGYGLPSQDIGMRSMGGKMRKLFNWNFCITDQEKRVKLIKEVYGVRVEPYEDCTLEFVTVQWAQMIAELYLSNAQAVMGGGYSYSYGPYTLGSYYNAAVTALQGEDGEAMLAALDALKAATEQTAEANGYGGKLKWRLDYEKETNEILVDFR